MRLMATAAALRPEGWICAETGDPPSDEQLLASVMDPAEGSPHALARARSLLEASGGLGGLHRTPRAVMREHGFSPEAIEAISAALELSARAAAMPPAQPMGAHSLAAMFRPLLGHLSHEEMHAVFLDARGRYAGRRRISSGGAAACSLYVRDVLGPVAEARACAFALVHNHPSGFCAPSPEDVALTDRLATAADVIGTRLVDHLVIADDGFASAMPSGGRWQTTGRTLSRVS